MNSFLSLHTYLASWQTTSFEKRILGTLGEDMTKILQAIYSAPAKLIVIFNSHEMDYLRGACLSVVKCFKIVRNKLSAAG